MILLHAFLFTAAPQEALCSRNNPTPDEFTIEEDPFVLHVDWNGEGAFRIGTLPFVQVSSHEKLVGKEIILDHVEVGAIVRTNFAGDFDFEVGVYTSTGIGFDASFVYKSYGTNSSTAV